MELKKGESKFEQATAGEQPAVISRFEDIGTQETRYGDRSQCRITYTLAELDSNGRQKRIAQTLTASLHEKSKLSALLTALLGEVPDVFKSDSLIGRQVVLNLGTVIKDGTPRVRLYGITPAPTGQNVKFDLPAGKVKAKMMKIARHPKRQKAQR
ncbi:MAG: hypothetical protein WCC22_07550 [Terriglobales bacterium]